MNNLIEIKESTVGQEIVQTVNARELHAFFEITSKFADWIKIVLKNVTFEKISIL